MHARKSYFGWLVLGFLLTAVVFAWPQSAPTHRIVVSGAGVEFEATYVSGLGTKVIWYQSPDPKGSFGAREQALTGNLRVKRLKRDEDLRDWQADTLAAIENHGSYARNLRVTFLDRDGRPTGEQFDLIDAWPFKYEVSGSVEEQAHLPYEYVTIAYSLLQRVP
jgi:hypothetical protein